MGRMDQNRFWGTIERGGELPWFGRCPAKGKRKHEEKGKTCGSMGITRDSREKNWHSHAPVGE